MTRRKALEAEIVRLKYRIAELEERLCPCEQHEWIYLGSDYEDGNGVGDVTLLRTYKCKRCGKKVKTWRIFQEGGKE